jgi:DNA repair exonuclease SbcCD ATPase subunit
MKLHCIELENWRQHTKTRIDFDEKSTVIYGPNEAGKSTILEALSRGLFDKSGSQAESIRRIKPLTASGNVTSTVRIEFSLNSTRYLIEKHFNLNRGTSLYKFNGVTNILLDQDNSADEQILQLLEADLPSTRGSRPSQWGVFQWLWAPQEHRELPSDKDGDPTTNLYLDTKDGGSVLVTPKFQSVQNFVLTSYSRYFTKTGKTSTNSPISTIETDIQVLEHKSAELNSKITNVDLEKQQLEILQEQLPVLEKNIMDTKYELSTARNEAIDFSSVESELKASIASVNEAQRDVRDAENALTELEESAEKIEHFQEKEKNARESLSRLEAICDMLEKRQHETKEQVEEKAMKIRTCEALTRDARILWTKFDAMKNIELLKNKIQKINGINAEIERLRQDEIPIVPGDDEINKIIQSKTRIEALNESLAAHGLSITITPGNQGSLSVEVDGERIKHGKLTATGTQSVSVGAPGLGMVTVKAKLDQAHDAKIDIQQHKERIREALTKYAVNSIDELIELNRTQNEISNLIKELIAEKKGVDERSIDEVTTELNKLIEKYEEYNKTERTADLIQLNPVDCDLENLVRKREREQEETRSDLDSARARRDENDTELIAKKEQLAEIRAVQKHCFEELDNARTHERKIIRQYGSVENQIKILSNAKANLETRTRAYEKIKQRHEELEKGPLNRIKRLELQQKHQEELVQKHRTAIDQLIGGIKQASLEGAYSELADIESQIEILYERLENEQVRAGSYKLLKETLENQYRSTLSAVVGPIQDEIRRMLSYTTGFLHEDVELNEYLFPTRLGERGFEDISLEFNDGSSGLKEVLALCVRLAVANHLSERDTQCLVLDDPFVHVSSDRSNRMIELINETINENGLQVIIFTHRPMEFSGFTGKMIDIQSVK